MCRTGDGEVRRCDIQGFDSILGHFVKVWRVHITVVIPSETIEGDEQQLLSLVVYRSAEDGWGPEEAETGCPQHGEHRHFTDLNWISSPANTLIYKRTHLLASHLRLLKPTAFEQSFSTYLILQIGQTLSQQFSACSSIMFMSHFYGWELCSQRISPSFCSWGLAVKQINLSGHRGCLFLPLARLLMLSFCLSACLSVCQTFLWIIENGAGDWHFDGFHLELVLFMIDLTPGKWRGKWEYISLRHLAEFSREDPNGRIHFNKSNVCVLASGCC